MTTKIMLNIEESNIIIDALKDSNYTINNDFNDKMFSDLRNENKR